jgi:hypothetical protein
MITQWIVLACPVSLGDLLQELPDEPSPPRFGICGPRQRVISKLLFPRDKVQIRFYPSRCDKDGIEQRLACYPVGDVAKLAGSVPVIDHQHSARTLLDRNLQIRYVLHWKMFLITR